MSRTTLSPLAKSRPLTSMSSFSEKESKTNLKSMNYNHNSKTSTRFDLKNSHSIATRSGVIVIPAPKKSSKIKMEKLPSSPRLECDLLDSMPQKVKCNLDQLVGKTPRDIMARIRDKPVFLATLKQDGVIDPIKIAKICENLTSRELELLSHHLALEINFYYSILAAPSSRAAEIAISEILPFSTVLFWIKPKDDDYLFSPTLNETLETDESIIGYCISKRKIFVMDDPANHEGFDIDNDLPLLRGCKSMILLPVITDYGDPVAVLQCAGYWDVIMNEQISIPKYIVSLLKSGREQIHYFDDTFQIPKEVDHNIANIFSDLKSPENTIKTAIKFIKDVFDCQAAEIYSFDERKRKLKDLLTKEEYSELQGGISFKAALNDTPIFVHHGQRLKPIDTRYTNTSILSNAYHIKPDTYVITLRSKWKNSSFYPKDAVILDSIANPIVAAIRISEIAESHINDTLAGKHNDFLYDILSNSLDNFVKGGDCHKIISDAANKIFGAQYCYVCVPIDNEMIYTPTNVRAKTDKTVGGDAYYYREFTKYSEKYETKVYEDLGIEMTSSVAFPLYRDGKVVASIELVNPQSTDFDKEGLQILNNIAAFTAF